MRSRAISAPTLHIILYYYLFNPCPSLPPILLGFGLSSRPDFYDSIQSTGKEPTSVEGAESFFVDSLEEWRKAQNIEKMVLAGHSMGGYLSVAYTEKYPERVSKLILISPVGE